MINKLILSLTGFGILLVVIGHASGVLPALEAEISAVDAMYRIYTQLHGVIYTFHMPFFFCISGFLYFYTGSNFKSSWATFLTKKAERLLIPYLAISTVVYPLKVLMSSFAMRPQAFDVGGYFNALIIPWMNPIVFFWFLPTLFVILIFSKVTVKKEKNITYDIGLLILGVVLFFAFEHEQLDGVLSIMNIGGAMHNYIFFLAGVLISKYFDRIIFGGKQHILLAIPFFLILPFFPLSASQPVVLFLFSLFGIALSLFMVKSYPLPFFETLGKYAYQIYLLSWFPQIFIRILFGQIWFVNVWLNITLSITFGILAPILVVKLLERFPIKLLNKCLAIK